MEVQTKTSTLISIGNHQFGVTETYDEVSDAVMYADSDEAPRTLVELHTAEGPVRIRADAVTVVQPLVRR